MMVRVIILLSILITTSCAQMKSVNKSRLNHRAMASTSARMTPQLDSRINKLCAGNNQQGNQGCLTCAK